MLVERCWLCLGLDGGRRSGRIGEESNVIQRSAETLKGVKQWKSRVEGASDISWPWHSTLVQYQGKSLRRLPKLDSANTGLSMAMDTYTDGTEHSRSVASYFTLIERNETGKFQP